MTDIRRDRPPASPAQEALGMLIATLALLLFLGWRGNWMWAIGAVVGVFVHEYGHVLAMNALGMGPAMFRIIPFMGGAATPARPAPTEFKDVMVSLAGPSFGLLAALPFYALAGITQQPMWLSAAIAVAVINLLNLIPAPPLDGSRALGPVLAKIHPQFERGVLVVVGALAVIWCLQRGMMMFGLFVGISVFAALKRSTIRPFALKLTHRQQVASVVLYLATAGLCIALLAETRSLMELSTDPRELLGMFGLHL